MHATEGGSRQGRWSGGAQGSAVAAVGCFVGGGTAGSGLERAQASAGHRARVTRVRQLGPVAWLMVVQGFGTLDAEGARAQGKGRALEEM